MKLSSKVEKAIIVAAGWGTRFLPVTKSVPKEMIPLIDKPLIHYAVKEAVDSGIRQIIIITAPGKQVIEDYFKKDHALEAFLEHKGKRTLLKEIRDLADMAKYYYVQQKARNGLGHALSMARDIVGNEPFAAILPDDIIVSEIPALKQLLGIFNEHHSTILAVEKIPVSDYQKYGVISAHPLGENTYRVNKLVEKPTPENAPSNLGIVGRYILTPEIFDAIDKTTPDSRGEIQLTDALQILLEEQQVFALKFSGQRLDAGTPLGFIKAQISLGLDHPQFSAELSKYMKQYVEHGHFAH